MNDTQQTAKAYYDKAYYDKFDIMVRFDVGESVAQAIIRGIKSTCNGGRLGKGKVLACELENWENYLPRNKEKARTENGTI